MRIEGCNFDIELELAGKNGMVTRSSFHEDLPITCDRDKMFAETIERLVLAHACEGVKVYNKKYRRGLETVIDAYANEYDEDD